MLLFFVIWTIVLVAFTCSGALWFPDVDRIKTIDEGLIYWLESSLGNWDIGIFDSYLEDNGNDQKTMRFMGIAFVMAFVLINLLILINVVIAMMADTYALMTSVRKGVYNYNIVKTAAAYKLDKYYGGLILLMPPFCIVTFLLLPFYLLIKDKNKLKAFNSGVYMFTYLLLLIPLCAFHAVINLIMMPFAYLKSVWLKINLVKMEVIEFQALLIYILCGLPILLIAQFTDLWAFIKASKCTDKRYQSDDIFVISQKQFYFAYKIFKAFEQNASVTGLKVKAIDLVLYLRKEMNLEENIMSAVYGILPQPKTSADEANAQTDEAKQEKKN